jgi:hypothetical protein
MTMGLCTDAALDLERIEFVDCRADLRTTRPEPKEAWSKDVLVVKEGAWI